MYIYCNYKQQIEQSVLNLITSLLKQLVQDHVVTYQRVKDIYKRHKKTGTRLILDDALSMLRLETEKYSKVFIVVDALDECSEVDGTRGRILAALRALTSTVNLLVTSRDLSSIAADFQETRHLEIYARDDDIRKYIESRVPGESRLAKHVDGHPMLLEEIVNRIVENVQGMYVPYIFS